MCGILLLSGPESETRLPLCLNRLAHRGPDDKQTWHQEQLSLGFTRLAINGSLKEGKQPYSYKHWVVTINGEIYNHHQLAQAYDLPTEECDSHIILPLFDKIGPAIINKLDGFYSSVIINTKTQQAYCLRDHMGKKPLFVGCSNSEVFITSELKAINNITWFKVIPLGASEVNLITGEVTQLKAHQSPKTPGNIKHLLEQSIYKRMPAENQPLGLFLSGGLDSSLIASIASKVREDITYFTLGSSHSPDQKAVKTIVDTLDLRDVRFISLPSEQELPHLISQIVYATESYNPSIVSNGLATWLLAKEAHKANIKVVLTGEGADELFGGYHHFKAADPWQQTRNQLINDMQFTELRRLDMSSMANGIEARCPFLDSRLRSYSNQLSFDQFYSTNENKVTLRNSFSGYLPDEILHRNKTSCDVGSGIRAMVVRYLRRNGRSEREELLEIWKERFDFDHTQPYFHEYPVFDDLIDQRGATHR